MDVLKLTKDFYFSDLKRLVYPSHRIGLSEAVPAFPWENLELRHSLCSFSRGPDRERQGDTFSNVRGPSGTPFTYCMDVRSEEGFLL